MNAYRSLSVEEWTQFAAVLEKLGCNNTDSIARFIDSRLGKVYDVFLIDQNLVLKKSERDKVKYDRFFAGHNFAVPPILDRFQIGEETWITMPFINGTDARYCTPEEAMRVGAELARIQSYYLTPGGHTESSDSYFKKNMLRFWEKIHVYFSAYEDVFSFVQDRFFSAPHSLIHDDFLPINVLLNNENIWIIDWAHADIFPYFLDLARFAFITDENGGFFISQPAADAFLDSYYAKMRNHPNFSVDKQQFYCDVAISAFCQYSMFLFYADDSAHIQETADYAFLVKIMEYLDKARLSASY